MRNKGSSTTTATGTTDESPPTLGRPDTQIGPPTRLESVLIEEVPTLERSVAEYRTWIQTWLLLWLNMMPVTSVKS